MTLSLGLLGVDSPHAAAFTRLLNGVDGAAPQVAGASMVAAWRGEPALDLPLSRDRIGPFAEKVEALGVPVSDDFDAVVEQSDALLVVAVDVRQHPGIVERAVKSGKPIYVDTRFAPTVVEADRMLALAADAGAPLLGGSPKRFARAFTDAVAPGPIEGIDLNGPMPLQPPFEGVAWYGVHMIDMAIAAMGAECVAVTAVGGAHEVFTLEWSDGRVASIRGVPAWTPHTRGTVHRQSGSVPFDVSAEESMLAPLLDSIVRSCSTGVPNVPAAQLRSTVAVVEAANRARRVGRARVV